MSFLSDLFALEAGLVEMFTRGSVIYWLVFVLLKIAGRRDVGSLGTADLLVLVLVADAAGNAMSGDSSSLGDGMIVVTTIVGWSVVIDRMGYRIPVLRKFLEPSRVLLISDGRLNHQGMRKEHVTRGELLEQLRLNGITKISDVRRMYIESNGQISVITRDPASNPKDSTLEE